MRVKLSQRLNFEATFDYPITVYLTYSIISLLQRQWPGLNNDFAVLINIQDFDE